MAQKRDSHGRYKADHTRRNRMIGVATVVGAGASAVAAALHFGLLDKVLPDREGHDAPDLDEDAPEPGRGGRRAPVDFRPDPTARVSRADRESLRPATGTGPSITEPEGSMASQAGPGGA